MLIKARTNGSIGQIIIVLIKARTNGSIGQIIIVLIKARANGSIGQIIISNRQITITSNLVEVSTLS